MAQSMEPLQSFTCLIDKIPQWLAKLDDLTAQCDEQYERFYRLTKHGEVKLTRKKKHASTESLRPKDIITIPFLQVDDTLTTPPVPQNITAALAEASQTPQLYSLAPQNPTQSTLKRKSGSALSTASGNDGSRSKSMVVVYYDSAIQEGFEDIVKSVSNARSDLRKGRTTATFQARMATMGLVFESAGHDTLPRTKMMLPSFGKRETATDKQKFKVYDDADRDLEEAQTLSERAAHQFLRDGDCKIEMEATRKRLQVVNELAEKEVQRLKKADEELKQIETSVPIQEKNVEPLYEQVGVTSLIPPPPSEPVEVEIPPPKQMHFSATGIIEVDDAASDESSIKIDMSAIRRATRRAM